MRTLTIYLAGSIRDTKPEDVEWRESFIDRFAAYINDGSVSILSPLAGKSLCNGKWNAHGVHCDTSYIVNSDFWSVDRADVIVFNLLALGDKYPCIGTLLEFGRSTSWSVLRYGILPSSYTGHENEQFQNMVHPFLKSQCAAVFSTTEACLHHLCHSIPSLAGTSPRARIYADGRAADELLRKLPGGAFYNT